MNSYLFLEAVCQAFASAIISRVHNLELVLLAIYYSYQGRARLHVHFWAISRHSHVNVDLVPIELSDLNPKLHVEYTTPFS